MHFTWAKSRTKFNPKMQDFKRGLDSNRKQKKDWTTKLFHLISNVKNLVPSIGSEYVQNVIQWR